MKYNFTHYYDASHGWVEVPYDLLIELGIESKITKYSYERKLGGVRYAFLEQDQDVGILLESLKEAGHEYALTSQESGNYTDSGLSAIRHYTPFGKNNNTQQHKGE